MLLAFVTFWVGLVVGVERVAVPLLGASDFHLSSFLLILSFVAVFGFVKATVNLVGGAWADRVGRRTSIAAGLVVAGVAVAPLVVTEGFWEWGAAAALAGAGMALIDPTLIARAAGLAVPEHRGAYLGTFRFWRDAGYGFAGVSLGILADVRGLSVALFAVALFMVVSAAAYLLLDGDPAKERAGPGLMGAGLRTRTP
ncbi:MAG TPA: MFS transporter [Thermoplasmata archaeon]|nr:MFS transporter [Thermoplasmata archaeon]